MSFSSVNDEQLADFVSRNPALYDSNVPGYKDIFLRDNLWRDISTTLNKTEEDCKKRWKSLRDSFIRCKHKEKKHRKTTTWHLYDRLLFLNNVVAIKGNREGTPVKVEPNDVSNDATNDADTTEGGNDSTNDASPSLTVQNTKKRPHEDFIEMLNEMKRKRDDKSYVTDSDSGRFRDSVETFGEHVKAVLNTLPHSQFIWAKAEIFNILTKYEIENIESNQTAGTSE